MGILGWYIETAMAAGVLALVCAVLVRGTRLGPAVRHAFWVVVLVKMMTPTLMRWPGEVPVVGLPATAVVARESIALEALRPFAVGEGAELSELGKGERNAPVAEVARATESLMVGISWGDLLWRCLVGTWVVGTVWVVTRQMLGIAGFARRMRRGAAVPGWLVEELEEVAERLGVRVPEARAVAGVETPLLWCLGRPVLIVPAELVESLSRSRWGCVLAHELAHLRRGDPWVGRLLLVAEWLWWWNPVYWWVRSRIEAEAELACDALVVELSGRSRREYAESLIDVCALRRATAPLGSLPALGLGRGGAGRFFERRLTMIVRGTGTRGWSWRSRLAVGLIALAGLPGWTSAQEERSTDAPERPKAEQRELRRQRTEARRQEARAELEKARAELERAKAELEARVKAMEERAKAEGEEASGEIQEELKELKDSPEMKELGDELSGLMKELSKLGPMIQEQIMAELKEAGPEIESKLRGLGPQIQEEVRRELENAREELRRARREARESVGDVGEEMEAPEPPDAPAPPDGPRPAGRRTMRPGMPRTPMPPGNMMRGGQPGMQGRGPGGGMGMMMGGGGPRQQELEQRIDRLEEKFDTVLEEIRAMRQEMRERGGR